jgi:catechol 2,3-dioxygenase
MDQSLELGAVHLTVADLERSLTYYTDTIGMQVLDHDTGRARLGVPGRTLVALEEEPGAVAPLPSSPGLSHVAPLVPTRADLARFIRHYTAREPDYQLVNHSLTHSCYVTDPDGHTIEITCARPRDEWEWTGDQPAAVAHPMNLRDFADEPGTGLPFAGLPEGTTTGHVQLKVTDPGLTATEAFYCDLLGFTVEGRLGSMFLAVGVTRYRAELVFTNRFSPHGGEPAPEGTARLLHVDLRLPGPGSMQSLADRLAAAAYPHELAADTLLVRDPSGNLLRFTR